MIRILCRFALCFALVAVFAAPIWAGSSNSLLDVSADGKRVLAANADNDSVTVIDPAKKEKLCEIKVGDQPEGVAWIGNGPLALVSCYRDGTVVVVDTESGKVVQTLKVAAEPYGVITDKASQLAFVTHEYPGLVSEIDLKTMKVVRQIPAGSFTRGLALHPNEQTLYVTEFYTGILNAIDIKSGKIVDSWKGHTTDNLLRNVIIHPTRPKAYLPHIRSMVNVHQGAGSIFPQVSVCDLRKDKTERRSSTAMDSFNGVYVVTNPWEAAMAPNGKKFYVIYAGTDDMNICDVIDDDYKEINRSGFAVRVGKNPRAIRLSPDGNTVYVYNAMDFTVTVHSASMAKLATIPVCDAPKSADWVRGKILFNTADSPMSGRRWIACSSCHPDGSHDGRTWRQPEGLRNTTALVGQAHTHPLHWSGDRDEAQDFEYTIRGLLMQGPGLAKGKTIAGKKGFAKVELTQKCSGLSKDLDALAVYCNSFDFTLSPHSAAPGKLTETAERGKKLFFSAEVGCAKCHSGPYFTDSRVKEPLNIHDVGTGNDDPLEKMGTLYDTPTLLGIYRSAPYLHHGVAKTLRDVLTTHNKGDTHGKTSHLAAGDIDDLVEFLKALPYETPPDVTPNTVEFRFIPGKK